MTEMGIKVSPPPHYSEILLIQIFVMPLVKRKLQEGRFEDVVMMREAGTWVIRTHLLNDFTKRLVRYNICIEVRRSCFQD